MSNFVVRCALLALLMATPFLCFSGDTLRLPRGGIAPSGAPNPKQVTLGQATETDTAQMITVNAARTALDWPGGSGTGVRRLIYWALGSQASPSFWLYPVNGSNGGSTIMYRSKPFEKKQSGGNGTTSRTITGTHYFTGVGVGNSEPDGGQFQTSLPGNGIFVSGGGGSTHQYGMWQPIPTSPPDGDTQAEEVSVFANDLTNGGTAIPRWGSWGVRLAISQRTGTNDYQHKYWYDLLDDVNKTITVAQNFSQWTSNGVPPHPIIMVGQSTWVTYTDNHEEYCGPMRGFIWWNVDTISLSDLQAIAALETDAAVLAYCTTHSVPTPWFLNMNPKRNDAGTQFTDYSGNSHHGTWADDSSVSNRPTELTL